MACLAQMTKSPCLNLHRQNNPSSHSAPARLSKEGDLCQNKNNNNKKNPSSFAFWFKYYMHYIVHMSNKSTRSLSLFIFNQLTGLCWCKVSKQKAGKVQHNSDFVCYHLIWWNYCFTTHCCRPENIRNTAFVLVRMHDLGLNIANSLRLFVYHSQIQSALRIKAELQITFRKQSKNVILISCLTLDGCTLQVRITGLQIQQKTVKTNKQKKKNHTTY